GYAQDMDIMLYPNALVTVRPQELTEEFNFREPPPEYTFTTYTKHYYIGSERINSKLGTVNNLGLLCEEMGPSTDLINEMNDRANGANKWLEKLYHYLGKELEIATPYLYSTSHSLVCGFKSHNPKLYDAYWYHPDHLGSSSFITNTTGEISQHFEYLPFGETLVEEHLNSYNSPFKFNGKEYDAETGNYYYGARYMNPKWSTFLTPDPALERYPSISPYAYTLNNPVRYVDPTGMFVESRDDIILKGKNGNTITIPTADDNHRYIDLPFNLSESQTFDLGLGNINTNNLAVGYSIGLSAGASATVGSTGSANITVVNFPTSSEYNDYNYVFESYEYTYGGGTQLQVSANIEANFFVAYSNINGDRTPASFEGKASTYGLAFDIKAAKGGGISFYGFQTEDKYW